ncbi:MAG: hypothetical protein ACREEE_02070 [Dongiaceae bacterium]
MSETGRCDAKDRRTDLSCERVPEAGRRRCRRHGGAPGSGGPRGNQNRLVDGFYSAAAKAERDAVGKLLSQAWALVKEWEGE